MNGFRCKSCERKADIKLMLTTKKGRMQASAHCRHCGQIHRLGTERVKQVMDKIPDSYIRKYLNEKEGKDD